YQYAAQFMKCFKYCNFVSKLCKIAGTGKSGRAGTDHCNFVSVGLLGFLRFDIMLQSIVSNKSFQLTDRYRFSLDTADTFAFALGFLGTYTSADGRKCRGFTDHMISAFDITILDLCDKSGNID